MEYFYKDFLIISLIYSIHTKVPWEGTKVCKKKNLKSIDFMREKVRKKNLKYKFYRFDKEKNIQIFENGGWHFNNLCHQKRYQKN